MAALDKRVRDALADWRSEGRGWDSGFLGLVSRYVPWFDSERIEYAFTDSVAIRLHGGRGAGTNALLVATPAAWERMLQTQGTTFCDDRPALRPVPGQLPDAAAGDDGVGQFGVRGCSPAFGLVSIARDVTENTNQTESGAAAPHSKPPTGIVRTKRPPCSPTRSPSARSRW